MVKNNMWPYNSSLFSSNKLLSSVGKRTIEEDKLIKELLLKEVGKDNIRPTGYQVLLKLNVREDEEEEIRSKMETPSKFKNQDQFNTREGLILDWGPDAFAHPSRFPTGPWCQRGEWVLFSRYENSIFGVNGHALSFVTDDKILGVVDNPKDMDTSQLVGK